MCGILLVIYTSIANNISQSSQIFIQIIFFLLYGFVLETGMSLRKSNESNSTQIKFFISQLLQVFSFSFHKVTYIFRAGGSLGFELNGSTFLFLFEPLNFHYKISYGIAAADNISLNFIPLILIFWFFKK